MALEVARRGQQAQRPPRALRCLDRIGLPVRHRRQALLRPAPRNRIRACPTACGTAGRPSVAIEIGPASRNASGSNAATASCRAAEQFAQDLRLRHAEDRIGQAHARGQRLRQLQVRPRLALRRHRAVAVLHVVGAVGAVEVLGLQIGRRRQHDVGVARGHRQERIVHHGEQVLARQAAARLVGVGAGDRRIVRGDEERADRRVLQLQQRLAEPQMVDRARRGRTGRLAHRVVVELERRRGAGSAPPP